MKFRVTYRANRRIARKVNAAPTKPRTAATAIIPGHWITQATSKHTVVVHGLHPGGSDCNSMIHVASPTATPHARATRPTNVALTCRM